jgi:rhomboid protease GluP
MQYYPGINISRTRRDALPVATLLVGLLTAAVSIVALAHPDLLRLLERHPTGEGRPWLSWRLVTSLLVHDAWILMAFNLVGLAVVGPAVERRVGAARWIALYLVGGLVGELAGVFWQPVGAGNSVASFGLVGGLLTLMLDRRSAPPPFAALYAVAWVLVYVGLALGGITGAVIAGVLCGPLGALLARARARDASPRLLGATLAAGTLVLALLLCAARDIHGPPLIAGAALMMVLRRGELAEAGAR